MKEIINISFKKLREQTAIDFKLLDSNQLLLTHRNASSTFICKVYDLIRPREVKMQKPVSHDTMLILVTNYISGQARYEARKRNISFIETSGNAHIITDNIIVHIQGNKRVPRSENVSVVEDSNSLIELIEVLLLYPDKINESYYELALSLKQSKASLSINFSKLEKLKAITKNGYSRTIVNKDLLKEFYFQHKIDIHPKLNYLFFN